MSEGIFLVGGYPKGYDIPFHIHTRSDSVLIRLLKSHGLLSKVIILDLWISEKDEKEGKLTQIQKNFYKYQAENHTLVALGRHVEKVFKKYGIKCKYLPHPAARSSRDYKKLYYGLADLKKS
ncbi:MAG: hypothetical protein ACE5HI_01945 [bacterium]